MNFGCCVSSSEGRVSLETFLSKLGLVNCLKHLSKIDIITVDSLKKQSIHQFKALGFKPEVMKKLRQAINGDFCDISAEQLRFVTNDEEEEHLAQIAIKSAPNSKKQKTKVATFQTTFSNVGIQNKVGINENQAADHAATYLQEAINDLDCDKDNTNQLLSLGISSMLASNSDLKCCLPSSDGENVSQTSRTKQSLQGCNH